MSFPVSANGEVTGSVAMNATPKAQPPSTMCHQNGTAKYGLVVEPMPFSSEAMPMVPSATPAIVRPISPSMQACELTHMERQQIDLPLARQQHALMTAVAPKIEAAFDAFEKATGRRYSMVETFGMEDAELAVICIGTSVETAIEVAGELRAQGMKAGVVGIRVLRPWPFEKLAELLKGCKAIAALDRSSPHGTVGMLYNEISGTLFNTDTKAVLTNYIYGLGGRDLTKAHLVNIYNDLKANMEAGKPTTPLQQYIGVRGPKLAFL